MLGIFLLCVASSIACLMALTIPVAGPGQPVPADPHPDYTRKRNQVWVATLLLIVAIEFGAPVAAMTSIFVYAPQLSPQQPIHDRNPNTGDRSGAKRQNVSRGG